MTFEILPSSFRDPSGFLFVRDGVLYRQINRVYKTHYERLLGSGLYDELIRDGLLIAHEEVSIEPETDEDAYKLIKPELIRFISYPYEWCFSEYKDAALLTLEIQKRAMKKGMTLKDASAYNVQFRNSKPVLIDTLSFEIIKEGEPWVAYRQFCQHFLAPLSLMSLKDVRLGSLMKIYIDGVPLDLASSLLPFSSKLKFSLLTHIHIHSKAQRKYAEKVVKKDARKISKAGLIGIIESLRSAVKGLRWKPEGTEWAEYYENTNYSDEAFEEKKRIVGEYLGRTGNPDVVWDLGANTGEFSRIASSKGIETVSFDIDPAAVEQNYLIASKNGEQKLLPLLSDLTNPSPDLGWENRERDSLVKRGPADVVMALALIHHLAISNNVPLSRTASFFSQICSGHLIIEFVPKSDSKVKILLSTREDIFRDYNRESFEEEFGKMFTIIDSRKIPGSERTLYLMKKE